MATRFPEPPDWISGPLGEQIDKAPYKDLIDKKKLIKTAMPEIKETARFHMKWSVADDCLDKVANWHLNQMLGDFSKNPCRDIQNEDMKRLICKDLRMIRDSQSENGFLCKASDPGSKIEMLKTSHEVSEGDGPFPDKVFLISGEAEVIMSIYLWRDDMIHCLTFMLTWGTLEKLLPKENLMEMGVPISEKDLPDSLFYVTSSQSVILEQKELCKFLMAQEVFMMEDDPLLDYFNERIGLVRTIPEKSPYKTGPVGCDESTFSDIFLRWMEDLDVTSEDRFVLVKDYNPLSVGLLSAETAFQMLKLIIDPKTSGDDSDMIFVSYITECMASLKQLKDTGRIKSMNRWCFYPGLFRIEGAEEEDGDKVSRTSWMKNLEHFFPEWMTQKACQQVSWLHNRETHLWKMSEPSEGADSGAGISRAQVLEERYFSVKGETAKTKA